MLGKLMSDHASKSVCISIYIREHHQGVGSLVLELLGTIPLLPNPLLVEEESVELIGERDG